MKYFTLDWYHAADDDFDRDKAAHDQYARHLEEMQGVLPADTLALARLLGVEDALVVKARHDRARQILSLTLRAGYIGIGYYDLILTYQGAEITPEDEQTLALVARTTLHAWRHESDLVRHELDVTEDGRIEHSMLFHPGRAFTIRCHNLIWVRLPRPNRDFPRRFDRFPGGPVTNYGVDRQRKRS